MSETVSTIGGTGAPGRAPPGGSVIPAELDGEPLVGNYFVAAYPPFSTWTPQAVDDCIERLHAPPDGMLDDGGRRRPFGLYVHVPFCIKRCAYCYYLSYAGKDSKRIDEYLDALLAEVGRYARLPRFTGRHPQFVYFGGGTPSILDPRQIARLLVGVQSFFPSDRAREITFECAPQTVSAERLRVLRDAGVTRLSLGVQQLDDAVLAASGRVHLVADVERAYGEIRRTGFDIVNLDLMVGLVGETEESFARSLERVIELAPESITIYQLEIPPNTPLYRAVRDGRLPAPVPDWGMKYERLLRACDRLDAAGYERRSAYAFVRDARLHRFLYMEEQYRGADLLGCGVSAFSYIDGVHHQNVAALAEYVETVRLGRLPIERAVALGEEERLVREFALQLKLGRVDTAALRRRFGVDPIERFREPLALLERRGWLEAAPDEVRITAAGLPLVDRMVPLFYLPEHRDARYW